MPQMLPFIVKAQTYQSTFLFIAKMMPAQSYGR
jgi:hypothetical protein